MPQDTNLKQYYTSFKYQLLGYIKTKRFIGLTLFSLIVSIAVILLMFHVEYTTLKDSNSPTFFLNYLDTSLLDIIVVVGSFFGGDLISGDVGTGSAYYILVQPVKRSVLFLGKYTAALLSSFFIVFLYILVGIFASIDLYGKVTSKVALSLGLVLLMVAATIMLASFFSSIFKSPTSGMITSIVLLILVFPIITGIIGSLEGIYPIEFLTFAGEITYLIFNTEYPATKIVSPALHGLKIYTFNPALYQGIESLLIYLIVFGIISIVIYSRRQIEG